MKLTRKVLFCIVVSLTMAESLYAQDHLFYFSIQGSWDKQKQKDKAQFGGDNRLINTYFNTLTGALVTGGLDVNGSGELSFVVRASGNVDSLVIKKAVGQRYDSVVRKIVRSMSGKWRSDVVDGTKKDVTLTIWYHVFKGPKSKKSLEEYLAEANKAMQVSDFKKALKYAESVLDYDALNTDATIIKAKAMVNLNQGAQACEWMKSTLKYNNDKLMDAARVCCQ